MSVLVVAKFPADTDTFRKGLADRAGEFAAMSEQARAAGAIHHRFGIGDGVVMVVDEWESPQAFEAFFSQPELQEFIGAIGAAGPPDITVTEAITSPDQF
jgi:quinol monooxygenase YgiN